MSLARSYAKALFESLDDPSHATSYTQIAQDLTAFEGLLGLSSDLRMTLLSPGTSTQEKESITRLLCEKQQLSELGTKFLVLLAKKRRMNALTIIKDAFDSVRLESEGGLIGHVVSADAISEQDANEIEFAFSKKLGKKISLRTSIDSSLIAGVRVTVSGVTYDGSLKAQLERLKNKFVFVDSEKTA